MKRANKFVFISFISLFSFATTNAPAASLSSVDKLLTIYQLDAKQAFSAERGESFWKHSYPNSSGKNRSCSSCHSINLTLAGKHVKTGKTIDAMALSVNQDRLQKTRKIEKWFKRNCKWTLGRECSAQEKGDILVYLQQQ